MLPWHSHHRTNARKTHFSKNPKVANTEQRREKNTVKKKRNTCIVNVLEKKSSDDHSRRYHDGGRRKGRTASKSAFAVLSSLTFDERQQHAHLLSLVLALCLRVRSRPCGTRVTACKGAHRVCGVSCLVWRGVCLMRDGDCCLHTLCLAVAMLHLARHPALKESVRTSVAVLFLLHRCFGVVGPEPLLSAPRSCKVQVHEQETETRRLSASC